MSQTKHNHGANFGRKVDGCPRCAELSEGAPAITQPWHKAKRAERNALMLAIRTHDCRRSGCGPVCTAFDW